MASVDYKLCDVCGHKVFYDANIEDMRYRTSWDAPEAKGYKKIGLVALCGDCNESHEIKIIPRSDPR